MPSRKTLTRLRLVLLRVIATFARVLVLGRRFTDLHGAGLAAADGRGLDHRRRAGAVPRERPAARKAKLVERIAAGESELGHLWARILSSRAIGSASAATSARTWKGLHPVVERFRTVYAKGVTLSKEAMREVKARRRRNPELRKWDFLIQAACSV